MGRDRRPALLPIPAVGLRALYGEMGQRPDDRTAGTSRSRVRSGFRFRHTPIDEALQAALS